MAAEELLDYLRLEAEVHDGYTVHWSQRRNRSIGAIEKVETKWTRTEKRLGRGVFGQVWHEKTSSSDSRPNVRAVKQVDKQQMKEIGVDYRKELLALATFSKEEYRQAGVLVSFLNWFESHEFVFLAMEYFELGDLAANMSTVSSEDEARQITIDLLQGLRIMHSEGFTHRDLKPQNIFVVEKPPLSPRWWVKIGDFGISKRVKNEETALRTQTGTPFFQAPEIHGFIGHYEDEDGEYDNSVDIWSLGCVIYNISAQQVPFPKMSELNKFCQRRSQLPKAQLSRLLGQAGIEFVERLLIPEPTQRINVEQGLQDVWIVATAQPSAPVQPAPAVITLHAKVKSLMPGLDEEDEPRPTRFASRLGGSSDGDKSDTLRPVRDIPKRRYDSDLTDLAGTSVEEVHKSKPTNSKTSSIMPQAPARDIASSNLDHHGDLAPSRVPKGWKPMWHGEYKEWFYVNLHTKESTWDRPTASAPHGDDSTDSTALVSRYVKAPSQSLVPSKLDWTETITLLGHTDIVFDVKFSPDGRTLASGSTDGRCRLWNIATGKARDLSIASRWVRKVAFSPNGARLAAHISDRRVEVWDVATEQFYCEFRNVNSKRCGMVFSSDSRLLALSSLDRSWDGPIQIWDLESKDMHSQFERNSRMEPIADLAFSRDGTTLAACADRAIELWNVASRQCEHELNGHTEAVSSVAFSLDGTMLASGSFDATIRLWHSATRTLHHVLKGHNHCVWQIAFSPDGTLLASGSEDRTVRIWDTANGVQLHVLSGHRGRVYGVDFSRDGKVLASASSDKTIRLWGAVAGLAVDREGGRTRDSFGCDPT